MTRRRLSKKSSTLEKEEPAAAPSAPSAARLAAAVKAQLEKLAAAPLAPGLYIVSTPIGHLADISLRALAILASADTVLCEDTRHSRKLFSAYGVRAKLQAYHDFSGERDRARILAALGEGKSIALISDAGTPLIADPGFKLARAAITAGFDVVAIPGASAVLAALAASGLPSDQFHFGGFLPAKETARFERLRECRSIPGTLIFFEGASRLEGALEATSTVFADRLVVIARELTKHYEEILRGSAADLLQTIKKTPPLGEVVLLIGPGETRPATDEDIALALRAAMNTASLKDAVEDVAKGLGVARKIVYNLALQLRDETE
jgi:16S rRNA (cytidine1402-2'-O)-methyltransferase